MAYLNGAARPMSRISLDLPADLVRRVECQAAFLAMPRRELIEHAVAGLVREFEQIDAECGVACPDCGQMTEEGDGRRACPRCYWRGP